MFNTSFNPNWQRTLIVFLLTRTLDSSERKNWSWLIPSPSLYKVNTLFQSQTKKREIKIYISISSLLPPAATHFLFFSLLPHYLLFPPHTHVQIHIYPYINIYTEQHAEDLFIQSQKNGAEKISHRGRESQRGRGWEAFCWSCLSQCLR